jgi:colanic acid/amylovoran biosynthesis glycosyltransferase
MDQVRVGYLADQYPATSHTFILREVLALRALGIDIATFSTRRAGEEHILSADDERAFASTFAVLPIAPLALAASHLRALLTAPRAYLRTLVSAVGMGRGARGRLWQLFYFAEAVVLWTECRRQGIRHVHAHFTRPAADAALLVRRLGVAAGDGEVWTWSFSAHGADIYDTDPVALAAKVRDATTVICVSDYGRAQLMNLVSEEHWPKIHVVHCGIDLTRYPALGAARRTGERLRLLTVGRMVAVKGQAVLLRAVAQLLDRGVDVDLTIIGDGPLRSRLEAAAREHRIAARVRFAGRIGQDDILAFYEAADVFVLSSFAEGIPVVLMEAMATELPIVAPRIQGIPELVEHGRHGLLVSAGRSDLIAAAVAQLAADPARRASMGQAGRRQIAEQFELHRTARRLADVLRNAGGAGASGHG